ncbi:MAG: Holliday junction resolvase RuvX [Candidatus Berkelbacteria bacterium]|nr:Holliday junction resolvase RuvX [Candidatus Berkelbacteria bacterium]
MILEGRTVLALDVGEKRIGVALSHGVVAEGFGVLDFRKDKPEETIAKIKNIISEQKVDKIVIGLPLGRDGKETAQSQKIRAFTANLEGALGLECDFVEESYSTVEVEREQENLKEKGKLKSLDVDAEAARVILEQYLQENE